MNYVFHFNVVLDHLPELLEGAWLTIRLSAMAMALGLALAVVTAYARMTGPRPLVWLVAGYVELIRNTPFLVQNYSSSISRSPRLASGSRRTRRPLPP